MTENDQRLLAATAAAMKLLLDAAVSSRIRMIDQDAATALSTEIGAALGLCDALAPYAASGADAAARRPLLSRLGIG